MKDRLGCASGVKEEVTVAVAVAWRKREAGGHHFQWREAASQRHLGLGHLLSLVHLRIRWGMAEWGFDRVSLFLTYKIIFVNFFIKKMPCH